MSDSGQSEVGLLMRAIGELLQIANNAQCGDRARAEVWTHIEFCSDWLLDLVRAS